MQEPAKTTVDVLAGSVALASLVKWLPPLAALLTVFWTCLRIYDWFEGRFRKPPKD